MLLGIAPQEVRAAVRKNLEQTILVKNTGHFDAGMHGPYFLIKELMDDDRNDLIYQMAIKKDFPSWGNMLEQGAATSWESWTGGSHIHDTLISIGAWFIQGIGGIQADGGAGFRHFFLKPAPGGGLTFARTRYRSIHGTIVSNWRVGKRRDATGRDRAGRNDRHVEPAQRGAGGHHRRRTRGTQAAGVKFSRRRKRKAVIELASGSYQFVSKLAPK